jgi:Uma2 family endonuclease
MVVNLHRFTRDRYMQIVEAGALRARDRVELIDGVVVDMAPIGPSRDSVLYFLTQFFVRACATRAVVGAGGSIAPGEHSQPEPDLVLLRPRRDRYRKALPGADAVLPIIEIADSSRDFDLDAKATLYAMHKLADYWAVDLTDNTIRVHRKPSRGRYTDVKSVSKGVVRPLAFSDIALPISEAF